MKFQAAALFLGLAACGAPPTRVAPVIVEHQATVPAFQDSPCPSAADALPTLLVEHTVAGECEDSTVICLQVTDDPGHYQVSRLFADGRTELLDGALGEAPAHNPRAGNDLNRPSLHWVRGFDDERAWVSEDCHGARTVIPGGAARPMALGGFHREWFGPAGSEGRRELRNNGDPEMDPQMLVTLRDEFEDRELFRLTLPWSFDGGRERLFLGSAPLSFAVCSRKRGGGSRIERVLEGQQSAPEQVEGSCVAFTPQLDRFATSLAFPSHDPAFGIRVQTDRVPVDIPFGIAAEFDAIGRALVLTTTDDTSTLLQIDRDGSQTPLTTLAAQLDELAIQKDGTAAVLWRRQEASETGPNYAYLVVRRSETPTLSQFLLPPRTTLVTIAAPARSTAR